VLIDSEGYVRIADFDVSTLQHDGVARTVSGSPEYMAPELWRGQPYSTPVDWWAVGVMAYSMLVGDVNSPLNCQYSKVFQFQKCWMVWVRMGNHCAV